jgi:hypothetical protein
MKLMNRRSFLATTAAAAATLPTLRSIAQTASVSAATITLHPDQAAPAIPRNFVGLSYETQQLSDPSFFSRANSGLVAQFTALTPNGVLRIGGNTSDYGFWKPTPTSTAPPRAKREYKVGDPPPDLSYAVTPEAIHNLVAFLDATGWTCVYGINMGTNTTALAAEEAEFVTKALGPRLEYFQVGNEADRFGSTIRDPKTWNANSFVDEWLTFANAILERVPEARFGMPDIASNAKWFATIGDRLADSPIRSHIACLTHHYYFTGPPDNPKANPEALLHTDPKVAQVAATVRAAATKLNTAWRMTEGNSCYRGGKPGLSDVFAASLWAADYMLKLASLGYSGVNLHGGDGKMVAMSLGGKLPGDDLVHDDPASHPHPYYTPIAHIGDKYVAEPVNHGMRFAGRFAGTQLMPVDFAPGTVNATAYAAKLPGEHSPAGNILVAIINKDATQSLKVTLPARPILMDVTSAESLTATVVQTRRVTPSSGADVTVLAHSMAVFALYLKTETSG